MEFFNITIERSVLLCLIKSEDFLIKILNRLLPDPKIFSDLTHRFIYASIIKTYHSYSKLPTKEVLVGYAERSRNKPVLVEKIKIVIDRLYDMPLEEADKLNFDIHYDELLKLYEFRQAQEHTVRLINLVENRNIEGLKAEIDNFGIARYDSTIEEFEYAEGFKERFYDLKGRKERQDLYAPLQTPVCELNEVLEGGLFKELMLIAGNSSTGKSAMLHAFGITGMKTKKNGILFTIEMNKMEAAYRIDSAITGIDQNKFRNPVKNKFTMNDVRIWNEHIQKVKKDYGKLFIVSFLNGATVNDLRMKATEIMQRNKVRLDYILVDYLNDLKPIGKYSADKSFDAQGSLSWELHLVTRGFINYDHSKGLPVVTASQLRGEAKKYTSSQTVDKKRNLDERDIGLSKLTFHHSDVVAGIIEVNKDMNQLIVMKNRSGKRDAVIDVFPNFKCARFHDKELAYANATQMKEIESGLVEGKIEVSNV